MAYLSAQQRRQRTIFAAVAGVVGALGAVMILTRRNNALSAVSLVSSWKDKAEELTASRYEAGVNGTQRRLAVIERMYSGDLSANYLGSLSLLDAENLPPLTHEVQRWIYEGQNPSPGTCGQQRYLLGYQTNKQGLGSTFHVAASFLGNALQYGYIFQWEPSEYDPDEWDHAYKKNGTTFYTGQEWVDEGCGRNESYTNFDCILVPLSTCSAAEHATKENSLRVYPWFPTPDPISWDKNRCPEPWASRLKELYAAQGLDVSWEYLKYWWRAQAVAYIVRPNALTMGAISRLRKDPGLHRTYHSGEHQADRAMPYPLPKGTISMHVRHGDKGREMQLVSFSSYVEAAEKLITENPLNYKRIGFVSSEDQTVIDDAGNLTRIDTGTGPDYGWVVYTSNIQRSNSGPMEQLAQFGSKTQLTIQWLSQLFLTLECDTWLGTRNSNWNRLIDELRCTMVDKCHTHVFVELGQKHEWSEYHWRKTL